ncbi:MAG TPA: hypothetical protein VGL13_17995 [Polyangiaceae bacterium]
MVDEGVGQVRTFFTLVLGEQIDGPFAGFLGGSKISRLSQFYRSLVQFDGEGDGVG